MWVPEKLVPDQFENRIVKVRGIVGFGKSGPYYRVEEIEVNEA